MTNRSTGPACGNNPNHRMTPGDRQAVADFRAYLAARAALARIRQMADAWEQQLPDVIRTPAVVSALRAALDSAEPAAVPAAVAPPTQAELRQQLIAAIKTSPFKELRTVDYANGPLQITVNVDDLADAVLAVLPEPADRDEWDALVREADRLRRDGKTLHARAEKLDKQLAALQRQVPEPADRAAVLNAAALHLYTALFPAVYDDMGQKAAEGVNRAVSELRRMADETATTETPTVPVQHAPGKVICCADCRAKGYAVCLDEPAAGVRQDGAES